MRWMLMTYDALIYILVVLFFQFVYPNSNEMMTPGLAVANMALGVLCLAAARLIGQIYKQIWRYAGPTEYIRLMLSDGIACLAFLLLRGMFPHTVTVIRGFAIFALDLLICLIMRMGYQWVYSHRTGTKPLDRFAQRCLHVLTGFNATNEPKKQANPIRVAIIGAGNVGANLAMELRSNTVYQPVCFVDIDETKVGRQIEGIEVLRSEDNLHDLGVQEVIFALPNADDDRRQELYTMYRDFKIKTYDFATVDSQKRHLHDFNIEDLLFRRTNQVLSPEVMAWYEGKSVIITGGGGSIGSELARQIARCKPSRLVILDVYENGAYDIQQELRIQYGDSLNLRIEIASICDREKIEKIFSEHTPDIVLHAAAHKHVPLMERNVCEAVSNNVFGTLNVVEACEKYGVSRFIMVSTDKAVNPTNVMGATKRMCEMIVQSRTGSKTSFSATRFGNVLGSNGSVIPLFRRQIARGGPVTVTDKRIIRYFMTIPEASQLVMTSGAMAKNGELYVLDMGKPVKILDLAENMIRLSGFEPYKDIDIVETGLRPGEKLYEELLIKTEELDRTGHNLIFVERDRPLSREVIAEKLEILRKALTTQSNRIVKKALMEVVPTYHTPEEVNSEAIASAEMQMAAGV